MRLLKARLPRVGGETTLSSRHNEQPKEKYAVVTNKRGDVVYIYSFNGETKLASYGYDAWGNVVSVTDTSTTGIASINPIRYRGYYYDTDLDLYYLQSRYYNPRIGRFLNADGYISTGQGVLSHNMFAYCGNNPISRIDFNGYGWLSTTWNEFKNMVKSWFETDDEPDSNAMLYSEHHKRGTTNKSNKDKHDKGNSRRQKDQNGEKKNQKNQTPTNVIQ